MHVNALPEEIGRSLSERLGRLLATHGDLTSEDATMARQLGALPLGYLALKWYFLDPAGVMYTVPWATNDAQPERVTEEVWYWAAIRLGSLRYGELEAVIPKAPPAASACTTCDGEGVVSKPSTEADPPLIVCMVCGGLGWVLPKQWTPN